VPLANESSAASASGEGCFRGEKSHFFNAGLVWMAFSDAHLSLPQYTAKAPAGSVYHTILFSNENGFIGFGVRSPERFP
jgi:hypothetical protein